jgi:hypothetical protein
VFREVQEETGIPHSALELLDTYPEPLAYELPPAVWSKKTGRGQVGYWFLLRFHGAEAAIKLESGAEFCAWQWLPFARVVTRVVAFRQPVYRRLQERFKPHLVGLRRTLRKHGCQGWHKGGYPTRALHISTSLQRQCPITHSADNSRRPSR